MGRHAGRIQQWNDAKGYGFVTPHDGGARAFVHVKAFQVSARRPAEGDLVSYQATTDAKGRLNAVDVRFAGQRAAAPAAASARKAAQRRPAARIPRLAIGAWFLLAATALMVIGTLPAALALAYLAMSSASYLMYALDKDVAGKARWRRTPESTLHMLDLLGGWPGGLIAQQAARHKTAKASFQRVFWMTVLLNLAVSAHLWRSGMAAAWTQWLLG